MPQCLDRGLVGLEAEPFEVVEDGGLEVVAGTPAVVVFDAEQHPAVVAAGQSPHVDRVDQVSQVEEPCGCRRKPGDRRVVDGWGDGAMGEWFLVVESLRARGRRCQITAAEGDIGIVS